MKRLLAILLLSAACAAQAQQTVWQLYHSVGADTALLTRQVEPLLPPGVAIELRPLPSAAASDDEFSLVTEAIHAGISHLPALALKDARGVYDVLPLQGLSAERISEAAHEATHPEREQRAQARARLAVVYELWRLWGQSAGDTPRQDAIIARFRELMQRPDTELPLRQFIALRCLYPALMQQYAAAYQGAHTPYTEAKLLEAIRTLEEARDMEPLSRLGRSAYDEREKLRAARLKSRQYE